MRTSRVRSDLWTFCGTLRVCEFKSVCVYVCVYVSHAQDSVVVFRHILGFPTEELLRGPIMKELQEQLSQQMPYLHLIHWSVSVLLCHSAL